MCISSSLSCWHTAFYERVLQSILCQTWTQTVACSVYLHGGVQFAFKFCLMLFTLIFTWSGKSAWPNIKKKCLRNYVSAFVIIVKSHYRSFCMTSQSALCWNLEGQQAMFILYPAALSHIFTVYFLRLIFSANVWSGYCRYTDIASKFDPDCQGDFKWHATALCHIGWWKQLFCHTSQS